MDLLSGAVNEAGGVMARLGARPSLAVAVRSAAPSQAGEGSGGCGGQSQHNLHVERPRLGGGRRLL